MNNPIIVKGKHNEAVVYAKAVEANSEDKIRQYLNLPEFSGTKVRIMPDVHLGKGAVVGWTSTYKELVIPSIVGVDIGCGVCACNLGKGKLRFDKLDAYIRKNVPAGQNVRESLHEAFDEMVTSFTKENDKAGLQDPACFKNNLLLLCEKQNHNPERIFASLGTLGGGNHFIEIDIDENGNRWLLIHSGSRSLGVHTAEYHETVALRETPAESPVKYLFGEYADDYFADTRIVQHYARINRALMAHTIADGFFKVGIREADYRDSVHNYIDVDSLIIRKGAISAKLGEPVIIPFSMAEGAVLGRGKGNAEWNCSAPHGSGRKAARTQARNGLSLDEYRKQMRGIWSSVICKDTLEESPMAYKRSKDVLDYIGETVETEQRLRPLYNFKAAD
jgi:RNA-splicing ligase RtcB